MIINNKTKKIIPIFLVTVFLFGVCLVDFRQKAKAAEVTDLSVDFELYQKYDMFLKYEKKAKYSKYKKYARNKKKYGFADSGKKAQAKEAYLKYQLYKKNPAKYPDYAQFYNLYKKYAKYKKYVTPYSKYGRYSKYKAYDNSAYDEGRNYGGAEYKAGYDRYNAAIANLNATVGEADLNCDGGTCDGLGPDITVGLYSYTRSNLQSEDFKVTANKDYIIKNGSGVQIGETILAATETHVAYVSDKNFNVHNSVTPTTSNQNVYFESATPDDTDIIFHITRPSSSMDQYRGKINLHYVNADNSIWVINTLPMEHYVWGMGEIAGTGDADHNKVMTTIFRTYGYWKVKFSTKYAAYGFKVTSDSSSQIYYGYDWETAHPNIKIAANDTAGKIIRYLNPSTLIQEVTITPYSSWTDGRTRSFQERWGSTLYPWCQSVADSYGKHPTMTTAQLEAAGNHMVGLSAHGSLELATNHDKTWEYILNYYFTGINIYQAYSDPS